MAHWYEPKEKLKELMEKRIIKKHGGKREEWYGGRPFFDWVPDTLYHRNLFDLVIVPQNYKMVKLNLGTVGEIIREDGEGFIIPDERGEEDKLLGDHPLGPGEARRYRTFPWGGVFEPGLRIPITLFGLSRVAIVYVGQREDTVKDRNVLTRDPIQMQEVDALVTYHVHDPLLAMTGTEDGDFEGLTKRFAKARLTDVINNYTLDEILRAKDRQTNFVGLYDDNNQQVGRYNPIELQRAGITIDGIRVTEYKLTPEVETLFKSRIAASITAQAAEFHDRAGNIYTRNPGAREVLWTESASKPEGRVSYDVHIGMFARALEKLVEKLGR